MVLTSRLLFTIRTGPPRAYPSALLTRPALFTMPHRTVSTQSSDDPPLRPAATFSVSPIPKNPLGEGRYIRTAAALIIGDELLNGKTHDTNGNFLAKWCFERGIDLKRIEVIADDEDQIIEASRRMVKNYDFVVTSGGIGPTHGARYCIIFQPSSFQNLIISEDITYASLAKAFSQSLAHHPETLTRMSQMIKHRTWMATQTPQQRAATERMALFPDKAEVLFVAEDIWVPVVRLEGKLCIFPGIPSLFQKMITALTPLLPLPPWTERPSRIQVFTERPESMIAPYLTKLQIRLRPHGIQIGSYPVLGQGVFVSLIGRDRPLTTTSTPLAQFQTRADDRDEANTKGGPRILLADVVREVEREIGGQVVSEEEVAQRKGQCKELTAPVAIAASMGAERTVNMLKAKY